VQKSIQLAAFHGRVTEIPKTLPRSDWLAVQPVCYELVSAEEFPGTGKNTGNSAKNGAFARHQWPASI
jgi:hypothetical protein